ncbi:MAG TPA: phosphate ABC transporter permease subunit PstC [Micropepsaceae bacterium]|nr:phosphate ABC transporter permease subunit PstC [Micropepsaceae bacterium]
MADLILMQDAPYRLSSVRLQSSHRRDRIFRRVTFASAAFVLALFAGVLWTLISGAWLSLRTFGLSFLWTQAWNPVTEKFGALAPIYGTIITSLLAMLIAVPVAIGIAIFLTELCPRSLRRPIGITVELLAGIPSIIYGIWGFFALAPALQQSAMPGIIAAVANVPGLSSLFDAPAYGISVFTAGLILSVMILPFISAITRDVFETVPSVLTEAAYGLGATRWEVLWNVVLPYSRGGVVGGLMLGLGRALGETMAVTFVIGNAHRILPSLFAPGTTISATIANEFSEATGDLYPAALIELGLILFLLTFLVLGAAQYMLYRLERRAGTRT